MEDLEKIVRKFAQYTGLTISESRQFLDSKTWDLTGALLLYYKDKDLWSDTSSSSSTSSDTNYFRSKRSVTSDGEINSESDATMSDEDMESTDEKIITDLINYVLRRFQKLAGEQQVGKRQRCIEGIKIIVKENCNPDEGVTKQEVKLDLWKDGFTFNNGDLRLYGDPEQKSLLKKLCYGELDDNFLSQVGDIDYLIITVEDRRDEEYNPPKRRRKEFTGGGYVLGYEETETESKINLNETEFDCKVVEINESEPITTILIRLPDGSRMTIVMNTSHTLSDLKCAIRYRVAEARSNNFTISTMEIPPKGLTDDSKTLQDIGILRSALIVRFNQ